MATFVVDGSVLNEIEELATRIWSYGDRQSSIQAYLILKELFKLRSVEQQDEVNDSNLSDGDRP